MRYNLIFHVRVCIVPHFTPVFGPVLLIIFHVCVCIVPHFTPVFGPVLLIIFHVCVCIVPHFTPRVWASVTHHFSCMCVYCTFTDKLKQKRTKIINMFQKRICHSLRPPLHLHLYIYITLKSSGRDILHVVTCLDVCIIYFISCEYDTFFVILYTILQTAELDCCQIIILSIYVPFTHA
jgi:hypothetical protein